MKHQNFCERHPNACLERTTISGNYAYNTMAQPGIAPDYHRGSFNKPILTKSVTKSESLKALGLLGTKTATNYLKTIRVARVAKNDDPKMKDLEDTMFLISGKKEVPGYRFEMEGHKFAVYTNPEERKLRITFEGARGTKEDFKNVLNVIKNKPLEGEDVKQEEAFLANLFQNGTKKIHIDDEVYDDIKFLGHSLGGYKARYYGAKYNIDSELLNAHIMPWNTFPETTAKVNMHTIINDPVDMKFSIQPSENITHTYYQPLTKESTVFARQRLGEPENSSFLDPHYDISWQNLSREEQSGLTQAMKTHYPEFGIGVVGIAGSIYNASTDPHYDPKTDPLLGSASELGMVGLNIDPNYEWSDKAPPSSGVDWLIWKALNPIAKSIASSSNPMQVEEMGKRIEKESGSTLDSPLYNFSYNGDKYYYQKDSSGNPIWFTEGEPMRQDVKDAYQQAEQRDQQRQQEVEDINQDVMIWGGMP